VPLHLPVKPRFYTALIANLVISSLLLGVRSLGILEGWELKAYDQLIRLRRDEWPDRRLLVITIDEADIRYQKQMGMEGEGSLKDAALAQLLEKLEPHKPRTIGLNIYRDFPVRRDQPELARKLKTTDNFFAVCKPSDPEADQEGVAPPPEVSPERLGFSDVVPDKDGVLRRHLWYMTPNPIPPCLIERALSLQLALHYLVSEDIKPKISKEGSLLIEWLIGKEDSRNARLKRLESQAGGYQGLDNSGYQMLLNYRTRGKIAEQVSLRQILTEDFNPNLVVGRIILIGVTAPSVEDGLQTPYSQNQTMPGVCVQAQMVSQILSAVLDERPLLGVWPQWGDALWIWSWSLLGGMLAWRIQKVIPLGLATCVTIVTLYGVCFVLLLQGSWVPLVPSALAAIFTGGSVVAYTKSQFQ
jgi:CHASE2 domain-containing sensor protein